MWFGHIKAMDEGCWMCRCREYDVPGQRKWGRPVNTWDEVVMVLTDGEKSTEYGVQGTTVIITH